MIPKLRISGLKLSPELVLLQMPPGVDPPAGEILRRLAERRINLTCVVLENAGKGLGATCCIDAEEMPQAETVLESASAEIERTAAVGTLTVFPHRRRIDLLAAVLEVFGRRAIPLLGIASSPSALTFALPFRRLDDAVGAVCGVARLPDNHAPMRPQFRVRQL
jgi:hypothetical protein